MYPLVIVGGGIHGTTISCALSKLMPPAYHRVIDPHADILHQWSSNCRACGLSYLRSPMTHHIDTNPNSLARFRRHEKCNTDRGAPPFIPRYNRPLFTLFMRHAHHLYAQHALAQFRIQAYCHEITIAANHVTVETNDMPVQAQSILICTGMTQYLRYPQWAIPFRAMQHATPKVASAYATATATTASAKSTPTRNSPAHHIRHVFEEGFSPAHVCHSGHVLIVGGGITALQLALTLANSATPQPPPNTHAPSYSPHQKSDTPSHSPHPSHSHSPHPHSPHSHPHPPHAHSPYSPHQKSDTPSHSPHPPHPHPPHPHPPRPHSPQPQPPYSHAPHPHPPHAHLPHPPHAHLPHPPHAHLPHPHSSHAHSSRTHSSHLSDSHSSHPLHSPHPHSPHLSDSHSSDPSNSSHPHSPHPHPPRPHSPQPQPPYSHAPHPHPPRAHSPQPQPRCITVLSRHTLRYADFDSDPCYLGPACLKDFDALTDITQRKEEIAAARNRATIPPDIARRFRAACADGTCQLIIGEVSDIAPTKQRYAVQLKSGTTHLADDIVLATGFRTQAQNNPLIRDLAHRYNLPCDTDGTPIVDSQLRWHPRILLSGNYAQTTVGPAAGNIIGAHLALRRLLPLFMKRTYNRKYAWQPMPHT